MQIQQCHGQLLNQNPSENSEHNSLSQHKCSSKQFKLLLVLLKQKFHKLFSHTELTGRAQGLVSISEQ